MIFFNLIFPSNTFERLFSKSDQPSDAMSVIYNIDEVYDPTLPANVNECKFDLTDKSSFVDFWVFFFSS